MCWYCYCYRCFQYRYHAGPSKHSHFLQNTTYRRHFITAIVIIDIQIDTVWFTHGTVIFHSNDVIIGAMASQITSLTIVYLSVYSGADQRKHQSSPLLAFVRGIHR